MAEIFDALRRDGDSSNTIIGIVILVLMTVFVAPDVLPQLVSNSLPFIDEGLPCTIVMNAEDRSQHQSLIGRSATDPLTIRTEVLSYSADGTSPMVLRVIIINETIGTVPFVFNPNQVIVGNDTTSSGIGLIFNPAIPASLDYDGNGIANSRVAGQTSFALSDIRVLGPLQRCVHRIEIPASQLSGVQSGVTRVRAYYRILGAGSIQQLDPTAPIIYTDQGLGVISGGFVESPDVIIPVVAFTEVEQ